MELEMFLISQNYTLDSKLFDFRNVRVAWTFNSVHPLGEKVAYLKKNSKEAC